MTSSLHPAGGDWTERARRHGPLRLSELGPAPVPPPPPELAGWLARSVDRWWQGQARVDPYVLVVVSGDDGRLARRILDARPICAPALRYVLVDPFGGTARAPGFSSEQPAFLFPPGPGAEEDEPAPPAGGIGPLATSLAALPALPGSAGAVVALQFMSRLPADLFEQRDGAWFEVRVSAAGERMAVPAQADPRFPDPAGPGCYAMQAAAAGWLRRMLGCLGAGVLVVVDAWSALSGPLPAGGPARLALDQLRRVAAPSGGPEPVAGDLQAVTWRIG